MITRGKLIKRVQKVGYKNPPSRLGSKHTIESQEKMRQSALRKFRNGYVTPFKGRKHTEEAKEKNRQKHLGKPSWNKGMNWSEEFRNNVSESMKGLWQNKEYREHMIKVHYDVCKGEKNGNWKGGKSFEPYTVEFNKKLKDKIKVRDNYICQGCKTKKRLSIHHINYVKEDCRMENLITLCISCNPKANYNRKHWEKYYSNIIAAATTKRDDIPAMG